MNYSMVRFRQSIKSEYLLKHEDEETSIVKRDDYHTTKLKV